MFVRTGKHLFEALTLLGPIRAAVVRVALKQATVCTCMFAVVSISLLEFDAYGPLVWVFQPKPIRCEFSSTGNHWRQWGEGFLMTV